MWSTLVGVCGLCPAGAKFGKVLGVGLTCFDCPAGTCVTIYCFACPAGTCVKVYVCYNLLLRLSRWYVCHKIIAYLAWWIFLVVVAGLAVLRRDGGP